MPRERLSMRKIREVLRLRWEQGLSHRQIVASCLIAQGTVVEYLRRAHRAGLTWPLPADLSDSELEARLFPPPVATAGPRPLPDWEAVHRELKRKGVTLQLLWEEYQAAHPEALRSSRFCELYQAWSQAAEPRMHQTHPAGERLFVDYAGQTIPVIDGTSGGERQVQIFVATLGASNYTFAEATEGQTLSDWLGSHARAFAFFGGVPALVVPDNLKSGVKSPCYYEPDLNPSYHELARHYGTAILPARVRKPRDKSKVENGVQQVERRVLAPLRDRQFFSLAEVNQALRPLVEALNDRHTAGLPATRRELFETLDRPALQPLPTQPCELSVWKKARVGTDYHLQVDFHFYSVPHRCAREAVEVRLTAMIVEVFLRGERIASHQRSRQRYGYTTVAEHMPPHHRAYLHRSGERLLLRARGHGAAVEAYCRCEFLKFWPFFS